MTDDPRVAHLNAVATKVAAELHDPHFAGFIDRETLLFLARYDAVRDYERRQALTDEPHKIGSGYTQVDGRWVAGPSQPRWRHKKRGTVYVELGRGELQTARPYALPEGTRIVAYKGEDGKVWFRQELEFDDGRFEGVE